MGRKTVVVLLACEAFFLRRRYDLAVNHQGRGRIVIKRRNSQNRCHLRSAGRRSKSQDAKPDASSLEPAKKRRAGASLDPPQGAVKRRATNNNENQRSGFLAAVQPPVFAVALAISRNGLPWPPKTVPRLLSITFTVTPLP